MFVDGEFIDYLFQTAPEALGAMAFVRVEGDVLEFRDIALYCGAGMVRVPLGVGVLMRLAREVESVARDAGYAYLVLNGKRLTGARPGRIVNLRRRLG